MDGCFVVCIVDDAAVIRLPYPDNLGEFLPGVVYYEDTLDPEIVMENFLKEACHENSCLENRP